jgi:hypothetical protein
MECNKDITPSEQFQYQIENSCKWSKSAFNDVLHLTATVRSSLMSITHTLN